MQSSKQESLLNNSHKRAIIICFVLIISCLFIFRNLFFQPTLLLRSFGEQSIEPEIAFKNKKPTFIEFYAEWCEVCKEMAPNVSSLKETYEKDINFVFLNVDNPKWQNYLRKFNVNGIPQINLFNIEGNLVSTFIGKQEENKIQESLQNLNLGINSPNEILNNDLSLLKENKSFQASPRSHG